MRRRRRAYVPSPLVPHTTEPEEYRPARYIKVEEFPTWGEFVSYVTTPGEHKALHVSSTLDDRNHSGDWDLGAGWDGAVKLAWEGWSEGTDILLKVSSRFTGAIASRIERFNPYYHEESGGNLDVARYLDGEPECWLKLESVVTQGEGLKHITVTYCNVASWGVSGQTLLARGAAIASLIECLEYAGHRVRLIAATPIRNHGNSHAAHLLVTVKQFDQPLDPARMVYAIAHPASFRRLGFAWMEHLPSEYQSAFGGSYGRPGELPPEHRGDIYLGPMTQGEGGVNWNEPGAAEDWVIARLKEQGVVLAEELEER